MKRVTSRFYRSSLRPAPFDLVIAGRRFVVPAHTADVWIAAISDDDMVASVLPGLLEDGEDDRFWLLTEKDRINAKQLVRVACEAVTQAAGRKWWEAVALVGMAENEDGEFYGRLLLRGIDPTRISLGAWCSAAYALALTNADEKERMKFTTRLKAPPPGIEDDEDDDDDLSFESMVNTIRGMPGLGMGG
jgi:hypothetical protein